MKTKIFSLAPVPAASPSAKPSKDSGRGGVRAVLPRARFIMAAAVLGLFLYAYLTLGIETNAVLEVLVKSQFSAALYGAGLAGLSVLVWVFISLTVGRIFCSAFCPLGTAQEIFWRAGNFFRGRKAGPRGSSGRGGSKGPGYRRPAKFRRVILLLAGIGLALSSTSLTAFFDPVSNFTFGKAGRFFLPLMAVFDPISNFGRGMTALRELVYANPGAFTLGLALPCAFILIAALFRGRRFCDWCPVGQGLGILSRVSPLKMRISQSCVSCGKCEKKCPLRCIASQEKRIDSERCVLCFSCAPACPTGSIGWSRGYGRQSEKTSGASSLGRRDFLKKAAPFVCGAVYLLGADAGRLLRLGRFGGPPEGSASRAALRIMPPGAKNIGHYRSRCVGCAACVAACPSGVIQIVNSTRPVLDYTRAYCHYNCVECGRVCPTGAIQKLTLEEKHRTRIGISALVFENCVVKTKGEACGACAEVCPTRAVRMTAYPESGNSFLTRPVFDEAYCIGCGACLAACPAEPRAFRIAGVQEQSLTPGIRPAENTGKDEEEKKLYNPTEDFPF